MLEIKVTNKDKFKEVFGEDIEPVWSECSNGRTDHIITDERCRQCNDKWNCKRWLEMEWRKPKNVN